MRGNSELGGTAQSRRGRAALLGDRAAPEAFHVPCNLLVNPTAAVVPGFDRGAAVRGHTSGRQPAGDARSVFAGELGRSNAGLDRLCHALDDG